MKKTILSFVFILALTTIASAAPRFGLYGEQGKGLGVFVTDDIFNAKVTFGQLTDDSATTGTDKSSTLIDAGLNYKAALDSVTAFTVGVSYTTYSGNVVSSGQVSAAEHDATSYLSLNAGFERALSSNLILTTQASAYTTGEYKPKSGSTVKKTAIFSDGRVGVAYLF